MGNWESQEVVNRLPGETQLLSFHLSLTLSLWRLKLNKIQLTLASFLTYSHRHLGEVEYNEENKCQRIQVGSLSFVTFPLTINPPKWEWAEEIYEIN